MEPLRLARPLYLVAAACLLFLPGLGRRLFDEVAALFSSLALAADARLVSSAGVLLAERPSGE